MICVSIYHSRLFQSTVLIAHITCVYFRFVRRDLWVLDTKTFIWEEIKYVSGEWPAARYIRCDVM